MSRTAFKRDEIILLLGAGASVDAGVPDSNSMVEKIQISVSSNDPDWSHFRDLYNYIRSSILFADGLDGIFGEDVHFNIERLVNVLDELQKRERHTLYPFVGAWNSKLLELAGQEMEHVHKFRKLIVKILRDEWVALPKQETAAYYSGILRFQQECEYPLRVFSLNYDLCVEKVCGYENTQRGFVERMWDWRQFDETQDDSAPLLLYKLHGSTDWYFNEDGRVSFSDTTSTIQDEKVALIFGTSYKLQYVDPFLFLVYELRRWTLDATRIIVCVGYGFNDDHINGFLQQSLRQDRSRKLLAVVGSNNVGTSDDKNNQIVNRLNAERSQIQILACGAEKFLSEELSINLLSDFFPTESDLFPNIN